MKKLILLAISEILFCSMLFAQAPICITVVDAPCDGNYSRDSTLNSAGNEVEGLWISFDAGSGSNIVSWIVYLDNQLLFSGTGCGCGEMFYEDFRTDGQHYIVVQPEVSNCPGSNCQTATDNYVKVYSPKDGNPCYTDCSN